MHKWVFGVLTHLVASQHSVHVGANVAMANTHHAGSMFIWSKVKIDSCTAPLLKNGETFGLRVGFDCLHHPQYFPAIKSFARTFAFLTFFLTVIHLAVG